MSEITHLKTAPGDTWFVGDGLLRGVPSVAVDPKWDDQLVAASMDRKTALAWVEAGYMSEHRFREIYGD